VSVEPFPLKAVSREEADLLNRVFGGRSRFSFSGGPGAFTLLFVPSGSPFPPEVSARIEADGRSLRIDLDRFFFRAALEAFLGGEDAAGLPAEAREAAAEAFLEDLLDRFESWSGAKTAIGEIDFPAGGPETAATPGGLCPGIPLHFRLLRENGEGGTAAVSGRILLDPSALEWLAGLLSRLPPGAVAGYDDVPVEMAVEIGRVRVPLGDLRGLEKDDILLADSGAWEEGGEAAVRVGPGVSFPATLKGRTVTVRERRGEAMNAEHSTDRTGGNGTGGDPRLPNLDELEITLRFEAGSRKILLGELKTIGPGYTFELEGSPDRPVTIRANGKRIGSGELVRVADRVGVRVLELAREGDSHDAVS
jgi:type III secretion system YscQ/HrcQ family protein